MNEMSDELRKPFPPEAVKQREGASRRQFDYIEGENIIDRLITATGGVFDVEVLNGPELLTYPARTGEAKAFWQAKVRLTIPGLGSRTHVGTALPENEDAPKSAVTDGIKKAATLFGVALQLYEKGAKAAASAARPVRQETPKPKADPKGAMTEQQEAAILTFCDRQKWQPPDMSGWTQETAGGYLKQLQEEAKKTASKV